MSRNLFTAGILTVLALLPLYGITHGRYAQDTLGVLLTGHSNGHGADTTRDSHYGNDISWPGLDPITLHTLGLSPGRQTEQGEAALPPQGQSRTRSRRPDAEAGRTGTQGAVANAKASKRPRAPQRKPSATARRSTAHRHKPYRLLGTASYYGSEFRGRRTASGERFNPKAMTAAHKTLPLGSRVRVTNLRNGKSVEVTINDRGPYTGGRIIDLSKGAARKLDMIRSGTAKVRLEVLAKKNDNA
jgi:rare lipoprotein A